MTSVLTLLGYYLNYNYNLIATTTKSETDKKLDFCGYNYTLSIEHFCEQRHIQIL